MTDTTAQPSDGLEFVQSGIIRFHFSPEKAVRVRRPFLGELRDLRLALEAAYDDLAPVTTKAALEGQQLVEQRAQVAKELEDGAIDAEQFSERLTVLRVRDRTVGTELEEARERLMIAWWVQVFDLLAMDKVPDDYPAWIMDAQLPGRVLTHWRTVPAGPG